VQFHCRNRSFQAALVEEGGVGLEVVRRPGFVLFVDLPTLPLDLRRGDDVENLPAPVGEDAEVVLEDAAQ